MFNIGLAILALIFGVANVYIGTVSQDPLSMILGIFNLIMVALCIFTDTFE